MAQTETTRPAKLTSHRLKCIKVMCRKIILCNITLPLCQQSHGESRGKSAPVMCHDCEPVIFVMYCMFVLWGGAFLFPLFSLFLSLCASAIFAAGVVCPNWTAAGGAHQPQIGGAPPPISEQRLVVCNWLGLKI